MNIQMEEMYKARYEERGKELPRLWAHLAHSCPTCSAAQKLSKP